MSAWWFFFNHWVTSRQIDKFDKWSGGPAVPHNSIAACLTRSRSGCLGAACGVVAWATTWRLSQSRKSFSTIANSELLIGSMWSSLRIWSSPDLSASRTTAAALPLLTLRRWRTSAMASPNDSNEGVGSSRRKQAAACRGRARQSTRAVLAPCSVLRDQLASRQFASVLM